MRLHLHLLLAAGTLLAGCEGESIAGSAAETGEGPRCVIAANELGDGGVARDAIASLEHSPVVGQDDAEADYLEDDDRVVGIELDGRPVAVPLNLLYIHEVVNLDAGDLPGVEGGPKVAVTYCPLTGSSLVFDRSAVEGRTFGVSGLLLKNNLVLFDRTAEDEEDTIWSQMRGQGDGLCGPGAGSSLPLHPSLELRWEGWRALRPDGLVVARPPQSAISYRGNPWETYEEPDNPTVAVPMELDDRLPPKERVLGLPWGGDGGVAFPFSRLGSRTRRAVPTSREGRPVVVLWSAEHRTAAAYFTDHAEDGETTLEATDDGFRDRTTGSRWTIAGEAVDGPRAGERLEPVPEAYVAFWFAWAAFQPETIIWNRR